MKLFKIFIALAFLIIFASPTLAAEFDPIGDLYSNDTLLNLDLPIDSSNGGTIEDFSSEESPLVKLPAQQTNTLPIFLKNERNASTPRFALNQQDIPAKISSFSYALHSTINLSPTGPEATFLIALFLAFPATWIFRKFLNV
ncbi:hypothetical protein KAI54_02900 [Candidatus Gracilibacteria bacterium]|nr:hypothetical protein [Candidatus Gracilibacteria bacterium]